MIHLDHLTLQCLFLSAFFIMMWTMSANPLSVRRYQVQKEQACIRKVLQKEQACIRKVLRQESTHFRLSVRRYQVQKEQTYIHKALRQESTHLCPSVRPRQESTHLRLSVRRGPLAQTSNQGSEGPRSKQGKHVRFDESTTTEREQRRGRRWKRPRVWRKTQEQRKRDLKEVNRRWEEGYRRWVEEHANRHERRLQGMDADLDRKLQKSRQDTQQRLHLL